MAETEMVEKVARRIAQIVRPDAKERSDLSSVDVDGEIDLYEIARAAIEAMKDVPLDILHAMFEAMFVDKWDGSQAPMVGAGWDAAIDAALALARGEG